MSFNSKHKTENERRQLPPFDHSISCNTTDKARGLKRILLIVSGSISLILGLIGLLLPVLPTTPFLLLSAGCFLRSSRRLYLWLLNHRLFGSTIRNYLLCHAVRKRTRNSALIILWGSLLLSGILVQNLWVRIILSVVGGGVTWHLLSLQTFSGRTPELSSTDKTEDQAAGH